jgi:hypothetical protein
MARVSNPISMRRAGLKMWCNEEWCDNTFIRNNESHKYCPDCAEERQRQWDRNYWTTLPEEKREARRERDRRRYQAMAPEKKQARLEALRRDYDPPTRNRPSPTSPLISSLSNGRESGDGLEV